MINISWQEVAAAFTLFSIIVGFYTTVNVRLKVLEKEVEQLKSNEQETKRMFAAIQDKLQLILIELQNKQDK